MFRSTILRSRHQRVAGTVPTILALLTLAVLVVPLVLAAEEGGLPPAETILDRYVEVTGGLEAYDRIQNRVTHGTFEMVSQGITASITIYHARPNRIYRIVEADAFGQVTGGTDGKVVWEKSVMSGPVIKEGQETLDTLRDADFDRLVRWNEVYAGAETVAVETVAERPCYKVVMTPRTGKPQTFYYDRESGLLSKIETIVVTQMGDVPMEAFIESYRELDGIRFPDRIRQRVMGQERLITSTKIEHNVDLPDDRFDLPADVRALLEKEATAGS